MGITRLLITTIILFIIVVIILMVAIHIINKHIVFHHYVIISVGDKKVEKFTATVSDIKDPVPKQQVTTQCPSKSLNDIHASGRDKSKPYEILCKNKPDGDEMNDYFRKTIKAPVASATDKLPAMHNNQTDEDQPAIMGANYMIYNGNPNPYHLDYSLYDPKEPANTPVGVNYISDV